MTKTQMIAAALALSLSAGAALAGAKVELTDATEQQIRTTLTAQGYEVRKVKTEDGMYEAYAIKDGEKKEIYLDGDMNVVKVKED